MESVAKAPSQPAVLAESLQIMIAGVGSPEKYGGIQADVIWSVLDRAGLIG